MIINKVTSLHPIQGSRITNEQIQEHLDEQNALGYVLVSAVDQLQWYRFFWEKEENIE